MLTYLKRKQEEIYPYLAGITAGAYMDGKMGNKVNIDRVREAEYKIRDVLRQVYMQGSRKGVPEKIVL